jgi:hypothetical protein
MAGVTRRELNHHLYRLDDNNPLRAFPLRRAESGTARYT